MSLENIWLRRIYVALFYPLSLLPKSNYISKIDISSLLEAEDIYFVRKSELSKNEAFEKIGSIFKLREDALSPKDIFGMSMNIYSSSFKKRHLKYRLPLSSFGGKKWLKDSTKFFQKPAIDSVEIEKVGCSIFISGRKIHNKPQTYQAPKIEDLLAYKERFGKPAEVKVDNKTFFLVEGNCKILHDPLNMNYWHVEYNIFDYENSQIKKYGSAWVKQFCESVIANTIMLNSYPSFPLEKIPTIPNHFYLKSA